MTVWPVAGDWRWSLPRNTDKGDDMRRAANAERKGWPLVAAFFGSVLVLYGGIALAIYLAVSAIV